MNNLLNKKIKLSGRGSCLLLTAAFVVLVLVPACMAPPQTEVTVVNGNEATVMARDYVLETLAYPLTADFPLLDVRVRETPPGTWRVTSYVDAKNAFGVESRHDWSVTLKWTGGSEGQWNHPGNWSLLEMAVDGINVE